MVPYMRRASFGIAATVSAILASSGAMAIGTYARGWSALTLDGSWVVKYSQARLTAAPVLCTSGIGVVHGVVRISVGVLV